MIIIGIDPGYNGGIAVKDTKWSILEAIKMPDTDTVTLEYLKKWKANDNPVHVICEKVGGFIGSRKKQINISCPHCGGLVQYITNEADPSSAMFKFGDGNGVIRGICITLGFSYDTIAPKSWQKIHNLFKPKGMSKTQWKGILKDRAQKLFPQLKVTLATADALLILDVALRMPRIQSI
jgi:hypothetical protein